MARQLKQISPTNYPDALMIQFINECEGKIQTEFLRISEIDCQRYTEDDLDKPLIVSPPHDKLYYTYLCAMIDFTNGEYNKYQNAIVIANSFMAEWAAWFNRTHRRDGREYQGVFLSAYGIAVKWGYVGTEEEWLDSLKGERGPRGEPGPQGEQGIPGTVSFEELTEEQIAMLKGEKGDPGPAGKDGATGPAGKDGEQGSDGVSIASVVQTTTSTEDGGINVVSVTLSDGKVFRFNVRNGSKGSNGTNGTNGKNGRDGVSPTVTTSTITGGHRVSITDSTGTKSFDVKDGKNGDPGAPGYTPQRGTDYWTADDQAAIVREVLNELPELPEGGGGSIEIVQEPGDSETAVMSQAAVTTLVGDAVGWVAAALADI